MAENIGDVFAELRVNLEKFKTDFDTAEKLAKKRASKIEKVMSAAAGPLGVLTKGIGIALAPLRLIGKVLLAPLSLVGKALSGLWSIAKNVFSSIISIVKKTAIVLTALAVGTIGLSIVGFIKQERAERVMVAALRAQNAATADNISQLKEQASAIQSVTKFGDEYLLLLQAQALNLGANADSASDFVKAAIGLAAALGKDVNDSMIRYIALAAQGEFTMLQRYIPALRSATSEAEKFAIVQDFVSKGFVQAQEDAKSMGGQLIQLKNSFGDLLEQFGRIITTGSQGASVVGMIRAKIESLTQRLSLVPGQLGAIQDIAKRVIVTIGGAIAIGVEGVVSFGLAAFDTLKEVGVAIAKALDIDLEGNVFTELEILARRMILRIQFEFEKAAARLTLIWTEFLSVVIPRSFAEQEAFEQGELKRANERAIEFQTSEFKAFKDALKNVRVKVEERVAKAGGGTTAKELGDKVRDAFDTLESKGLDLFGKLATLLGVSEFVGPPAPVEGPQLPRVEAQGKGIKGVIHAIETALGTFKTGQVTEAVREQRRGNASLISIDAHLATIATGLGDSNIIAAT